MLKILLSLLLATLIGVLLLQLRQHRLEINYQTNQLHRQIEAAQSRLWNQQLQIATYTAPNAVFNTVNTEGLNMVPRFPVPPRGTTPTIESAEGINPTAE
jgi:cell division protein FtsL